MGLQRASQLRTEAWERRAASGGGMGLGEQRASGCRACWDFHGAKQVTVVAKETQGRHSSHLSGWDKNRVKRTSGARRKSSNMQTLTCRERTSEAQSGACLGGLGHSEEP